ncbi:effector-associated constant component EACC1 [Embleya sp. MST-111070]|uniref:effector-associated constant component EACC1 n=1 Tax=Embleya sp. MST-111070 TaxID=3398231 RepID=UPI003F7407A6
MEFRIRVDCADAEQARTAELTGEFADWLIEDRAVSTYAEIHRIRPATDQGAMSADLVSWIALATSSGFSLGSLVYAHLSYRASLPHRLRESTRLIVERDGTRVTIEGDSPDALARLAQALGATDDTPLA